MALHKNTYTPTSNGIYNCIFIVALLSTSRVWAKEAPPKEDFIMNHVKDTREWHIATIGHTHITLPLPVIIYAPGNGLEIFSSSRFTDEHHQRVPYKGYMLDDNDKIVALDQDRVLYDLSLTKNIAAMLLSLIHI